MGMKRMENWRNFLSLEGIDFTWKTPFAEWLKRDLSAQGWEVLLTRDPPYALSPWTQFYEFFERGDSISHVSEAFLLLTGRLDNYERVIRPALKRNAVVIADRYVDSWLAYQSFRLAPIFRRQEQRAGFPHLRPRESPWRGAPGAS
jgi:dTMP kinase